MHSLEDIGLNCGGYTLEYNPWMPLLELSSSGATDAFRRTYTDLAHLGTASLADIGRYDLQMKVW